jgi:hypothetical protein
MSVEALSTPLAPARARSALELFVWSRAALWALAVAAWLVRPATVHVPQMVGLRPAHAAAGWYPPWLHDLGPVTDVWTRWDSTWYLLIARHGYGAAKAAPAFYPLYPLLVRLLGRALGGHYALAGILISLGAALGAITLLERLLAPRLGSEPARRAVLYLSVFPTAFFLQAVYNESLFLLLVLAAFLLAERGRFLGAGATAGLVLLTRSAGFALLPALAVLAVRSPRPRNALAKLALAPALFALYPLYLQYRIGDGTAFLHAEGNLVWDRHLSAAGPFGGVWDGLAAGRRALGRLLAGAGTESVSLALQDLEQLLCLVLFVALLVVVWRRLPREWAIFATLALAIPLSFPSERSPLLSLPRFGLVLFPLWAALATVVARPRAHRLLVGASTLLLAAATVEWALWRWVA